MSAKAAILDIDGTLVDTNYHHAIAWHRAFCEHDVILPVWQIHRRIGMGGDQIVAELAGERVEGKLGDAIRDAEKGFYGELIVELKDRGHTVVLASSAKEDEVEHYLDLLDARDLAEEWTTSADVEATKPEPDLVHAALEKAGREDGVMIGDSTWDIEAAKRADVETLAVMTGGFSAAELQEAGAAAVYESVVELRQALDETALA